MRPAKRLSLAVILSSLMAGAATAGDPLPADTHVLFGGYLAGTAEIAAVRLAPDGALWIAGHATSKEFAGSANPRKLTRETSPFDSDVFVVRLDPYSRTLLSGAWLGSASIDHLIGLDFDAAGRAYVAGSTPSPYLPNIGGSERLDYRKTFIARLAPDAGSFEWVRMVGGTSDTDPVALCMTADGDPVVAGRTTGDFERVAPLPGTGFRSVNGVFVTRMSADGSRTVFSTTIDLVSDPVALVATPGGLVLAGREGSQAREFYGVQQLVDRPPGYRGSEHVLVEIDQAGTWVQRVGMIGRLEPTSLVSRTDGLYLTAIPAAVSLQPGEQPEPRETQVVRLDPSTWQIAASAALHGTDFRSDVTLSAGEDGGVWIAGETQAADFETTGSLRPRSSAGFGNAFVATLDRSDLHVTFSSFFGAAVLEPRLCPTAAGGVWLASAQPSGDLPVVRGDRIDPATGRFYLAEIREGDSPLVPRTPAGFSAQAIDGPAVRITFGDGGGGTTGYVVIRQHEGRWTRVAVLPPGATEWIDTDVLPDHGYTYSIQAMNEAGGSEPTPALAALIPPTLSVDLTRGQFRFARSRPFDFHGRGQFMGTVSRLDGGAVDIRTSGFDLVFFGTNGPETLVHVPAGSAGWTERRGLLRHDDGTQRFEFDPATGSFEARVSGTFRTTTNVLIGLQMRLGRDAGTSIDGWHRQGFVRLVTP